MFRIPLVVCAKISPVTLTKTALKTTGAVGANLAPAAEFSISRTPVLGQSGAQYCGSMAQPRIVIGQGALRGRTDTDWKGGQYLCFMGIPYAAPPVGELRFKPPKPPLKWQGERDCTKEGDMCFSKHVVYGIVGSEDCLFLNVYTPKLPSGGDDLLPVMVYVHGGGFTHGSGHKEMYGPDYLITKGIVMVSINYRLGALGFLSMEDSSLGVTGNAGIKDMAMALRWVKENIKHFGGQPNNVTLFGESAGSAAVQYLMLSPIAEGLFHKAIMQSGSVLNTWATGRRCAKELASKIGLESDDEKEILQFLMKQPVDQILKAQLDLYDPFLPYFERPFGAIIERPPSSEEILLRENPIDLITSGRYSKIPILAGYNDGEGMLLDVVNIRASGQTKRVSEFETTVPHMLKLKPGSEQSKMVANQIKKFYFGDETPNDTNKEKYYRMMGDINFIKGMYDTVVNHVKHNGLAYFYRFTVDLNLNVYKIMAGLDEKGCCHADDLGYIFKNAVMEAEPNSAEARVIERVTTMWTNFAKYGNPTPKPLDPVLGVTWEPISKQKFNFLDIGTELTPGTNPDWERMQFWEGIFRNSPITCKL